MGLITKTATWHKPKRHRTPPRRARAAGVALVTGGTGALGLQLGAWLVRTRRCGSLVHVSRSGDVGAANAPLLEALRQAVSEAGGEVSLSLVAADVTTADEVRALLAEHAHGLAHGGGLYHCAGVLDHGLLPSQSAERLGGVMLPTATAAVLLHELLAELAIAVGAFVLFSSVTSLAGAVGQTSYGAANAVLDALAGCGRRGLRHTAAWGRAGDARTSYGIGCLLEPGVARSKVSMFKCLPVGRIAWETLGLRCKTCGDVSARHAPRGSRGAGRRRPPASSVASLKWEAL